MKLRGRQDSFRGNNFYGQGGCRSWLRILLRQENWLVLYSQLWHQLSGKQGHAYRATNLLHNTGWAPQWNTQEHQGMSNNTEAWVRGIQSHEKQGHSDISDRDRETQGHCGKSYRDTESWITETKSHESQGTESWVTWTQRHMSTESWVKGTWRRASKWHDGISHKDMESWVTKLSRHESQKQAKRHE